MSTGIFAGYWCIKMGGLVEANPEDMSIGGFAMDTVIAPYFSTSLIVQLSIVIFLLIMVLGILPMFLISRISIVDELRA